MKLLQRSIAAATMAGLFALAGNSGTKAHPAKPIKPVNS